MHLKCGYFVLYTLIYRLTEWTKRFHLQNCQCWTVGAKIRNVLGLLGLLMHGKVVVEFGRKVFLVNSLLWKTLNVAKISITECSRVFMHMKTSSVTIQWNITTMRYRNDVIRSVLLLHILANLGMMLAQDYASCHAARNTQVMLVANKVQQLRWPAKSLDLNSNEQKLGGQWDFFKCIVILDSRFDY